MTARLPVKLCFLFCVGLGAATPCDALAEVDDASRLVPSSLHALQRRTAVEETRRGNAELYVFGSIPLIRPLDINDDDKKSAALTSYFKYQVSPIHVELVEDYRDKIDDQNLSLCFSQTINSVRIYGTAACGVVSGTDLTLARRFLVRPSGVDTQPRVSIEAAWQLLAKQASAAAEAHRPSGDLNVVFIDDNPILCWRLSVCDDFGEMTYFVDAHHGQLMARTRASYRSVGAAGQTYRCTAA